MEARNQFWYIRLSELGVGAIDQSNMAIAGPLRSIFSIASGEFAHEVERPIGGFGSFQSHTRGFFSAFARATCSLSVSSQYLGLGFNTPYSFDISKPNYSYTTQPITLQIRGCHSLWPLFPKRSPHMTDLKVAPHLHAFACMDSVCPSPLSFALLAVSHSLSSPAGTKIFQFPASARANVHGAIG